MRPTIVTRSFAAFLACASPLFAPSAASAQESVTQTAHRTAITRAALAAVPILSLASDASATYGGSADTSEFEFNVASGYHVMLRLRDARILFLDGSRAHIATQSGRLLRTVGRAGGGPGEYRALAGACVIANDSILLADATLQRISVLDASARYARSIDVSRLGLMYPNACFADGRVVLAATEVTSDRRLELALRIIDANGRVITTLHRQSPGPTLPELFRGRTSVFVSAERIVVALGGRGTITEFQADGTVARVLSLDRLAFPLLESEWWQGLESMIPARDDAARRRAARDRFGHLTPPPSWPAFERVLPDGAGGFWVELAHTGSSRPEDWLHIDANWQLVQRVRLAARGRSPRAVLAFDASSAFVREFDEDGFVVVTKRRFVPRGADVTP